MEEKLEEINGIPPEGTDRSDYRYSDEADKAEIERENKAQARRFQERLVEQKASPRYQELWEQRKNLPVCKERAMILERVRKNQARTN